MARYACASSSARWRSGRYWPMRRTSAVSMKSGSRSSTTDAAEAAAAAHRPPRIGRTPSAIPAFAADRYALEWCDSRARSGMSVSCSRAGRPRNSEMRSPVPSASSANTTSSSTSAPTVVSSSLTTVAFAFASATTCAFFPDLAGLTPASAVELAGFLAFPVAASDFAVFAGFPAFAPAFAALAGLAESSPLTLAGFADSSPLTLAGLAESAPLALAAAAVLSGFGTLALSALGTLAMAASPPAAAFPVAFLAAPFAAAADSDFFALATFVWFLASPASFFLIFPPAAAAFLAGLAAGASSPSSPAEDAASSALRPPAEALGLALDFPGSAVAQSAMWEQRSASSRSSTSRGRGDQGAIFPLLGRPTAATKI
uniref:Uncharacterized protein n=1 Tax=Setaria italica TaxID=4555 RepID=K3YI80_SETIT